MPYLKSPWPDVFSTPDNLNAYDTIIGQPHHDKWPDYTAHIEEETGKVRTFRELRGRIAVLAAALAGSTSQGGAGLGPGDREIIGIMSDNSSDYIVLVLALLRVAAPFVSIPPSSTPFELRHAFKVSKITRLFISHQCLASTLPIAQEHGIAADAMCIMDSQLKGYTSLDNLIENATIRKFPHSKARVVPKSTPAFLLFSSGTSGLPKAVIITHGNLYFAFRQGLSVHLHRLAVQKPSPPPTPDGLPVTLASLPMYHTFGLHISCLRAFIAPMRVVILPKWNTEKVLKAVPKHKVTILCMVPSMYHHLVNHPDFPKTDFSSVASAQNGAAHVPGGLLEKFLERTAKNTFFSDGYGMSEATALAIAKPFPGCLDGRLKVVPGALGVLLPGMEARIVREDGSEGDFNEVGELWLKGGNMVSGYLDNPQETRETFVDGWMRTGDYFKVDKDQNFYFADRAKDTLKVSGSQVSPIELEGVLLSHPDKLISDVAVAGVSGGGRRAGEKVPRAWIVLTERGKEIGETAVVKELEKWYQMHLSRFKWLRGGIEIVQEIPKSPTGKTLRRVLQNRHEEIVKIKAGL